MAKELCLLITERFEPTADLLIAEMRRRDVGCVRWNLDCYPVGSSFSYRIEKDKLAGELVSDGREIVLENVGSIWCRGFKPLGIPEGLSAAERVFVETEAARSLDALLSMGDFLWVNHPHRHITANAKAAQLSAAGRLGLEIPRSIVTNDPEQVRAFMKSIGC